MPEALVESELFGHERGAFTSAASRKLGKVELAKGGTLFLDEIGDMPLAAQVKLLRLLEERTYERVGGEETLESDARLVAATNRNLEQMVGDGTFREDLYYRLQVFPVQLPPLRERREDIELLAVYFAERMGTHLRKEISGIARQALTALSGEAAGADQRHHQGTEWSCGSAGSCPFHAAQPTEEAGYCPLTGCQAVLSCGRDSSPWGEKRIPIV